MFAPLLCRSLHKWYVSDPYRFDFYLCVFLLFCRSRTCLPRLFFLISFFLSLSVESCLLSSHCYWLASLSPMSSVLSCSMSRLHILASSLCAFLSDIIFMRLPFLSSPIHYSRLIVFYSSRCLPSFAGIFATTGFSHALVVTCQILSFFISGMLVFRLESRCSQVSWVMYRWVSYVLCPWYAVLLVLS